MNIVTVIPIVKSTIKHTLTYFTKEDVAKGSVVTIPLRKKKAHGLVVESKKVESAKSEIKSLSYSIRKIDGIQSHKFLSHAFVEAVETIADYYASNMGSMLSALIPNTILKHSVDIHYEPSGKPNGEFYETLLLQSDNEERYATYKSLIREEFARGKSVFFCLPTTEDLKNAKHALEKGIEKYTFTLHSLLPKKEVVDIWKRIISEPHPVLIIATGSFLSIPRDDISTIILEKESSRSYKMQSRPFADIRTIAQFIAKKANRKLVLGDTLLRSETLWEQKNGNYAELAPLKYRSLTTAECSIVDMRTPQDQKKKEFSILSEQLKDLLKRTYENSEHTFLFTGRKGLYPTTVCSDCGTVVVCKNCGAPVVLYGNPSNKTASSTGQEKSKGNLFVCHHCGERRDAQELCAYCKGWRLTPLGIGTEKVFEEISSLCTGATVIVFDKENIATHTQAVKVRDAFYNTPGSIMIGTEMALTYLNQKIGNTAVVSLDSFFSIPDFRIHEKIFHILLALRALSEKNMIVQTRQESTGANWKIFEYAVRGNLLDFYREEIEERKMVGYPPFTTYIKLTVEGSKSEVKKQMDQIVEFLKPYNLLVFDAFNPDKKQKHTVHGLLSLERGKWIDPELLKKLRMLPPFVSIKVDPDTLL